MLQITEDEFARIKPIIDENFPGVVYDFDQKVDSTSYTRKLAREDNLNLQKLNFAVRFKTVEGKTVCWDIAGAIELY